MIMAVVWAKEHELVGADVIWYKERWERGTVIENDRAKLVWDFEFNLRKTTTSGRPNLILEDKERKKIWIYDMVICARNNGTSRPNGWKNSQSIENERSS